jgi:hypothetical protein
VTFESPFATPVTLRNRLIRNYVASGTASFRTATLKLSSCEQSRASLGDDAFNADVARGTAMSLEDAANAALRALADQ